MAEHIFTSYSRKDERFVHKLISDLEHSGANIWLDQGDIKAGKKWRSEIVQAIEDGRFNALPGPTYATGFVRAYADYLGLDLVEPDRDGGEVTPVGVIGAHRSGDGIADQHHVEVADGIVDDLSALEHGERPGLFMFAEA